MPTDTDPLRGAAPKVETLEDAREWIHRLWRWSVDDARRMDRIEDKAARRRWWRR